MVGMVGMDGRNKYNSVGNGWSGRPLLYKGASDQPTNHPLLSIQVNNISDQPTILSIQVNNIFNQPSVPTIATTNLPAPPRLFHVDYQSARTRTPQPTTFDLLQPTGISKSLHSCWPCPTCTGNTDDLWHKVLRQHRALPSPNRSILLSTNTP
jgi:hypothetical protein